MLKVLVTGAFSTGKTTLVGELGAELCRTGLKVGQIEDVARTCPFPLNRDQTWHASLWLLTTQLVKEIESEIHGHDVTICDRGIPDILAHDLETEEDGSEWVGPLDPFLSKWLSTYDLILLSRVDETVPIIPDDLRTPDPEYRTRLDGLAAQVLDGRKQVFTLPSQSPDRLAYAFDAVVRSLSDAGWSRSLART